MGQYHDILGISSNATLQEVKAAYRKKAMQFHPDQCTAPDAAKKFIEINNAYRALIDPAFKPSKFVKKTSEKPIHSEPIRPDYLHIYNAPPPTKDIWGKPLKKEAWKDVFAGQYEKDKAPIYRPHKNYLEKEPEIDLWGQSSGDVFISGYWREYNRLKSVMAYEEPEKFWDTLEEWVKKNSQ